MDRTQKMSGRACGKLILFGEHAVVHGYPAVVAGLPRGATAAVAAASEHQLTLVNGRNGERIARARPTEDTQLGKSFAAILSKFQMALPINVNVTIDIPVGAGLGSSAAMATAAARAVATFAGMTDNLAVIESAVHESEAIFHGSPSGIDAAAALGGGAFKFQREGEGSSIEAIWVDPVRIVICEAGPPADTKEMVKKVTDFYHSRQNAVGSVFALIAELADEAAPALAEGDWQRVGDLMNINHGALVALGVSTPALDSACHIARQAGAYGAKLTGSGGGGCVFALTDDRTDDVLAAWKDMGYSGFEITIP